MICLIYPFGRCYQIQDCIFMTKTLVENSKYFLFLLTNPGQHQTVVILMLNELIPIFSGIYRSKTCKKLDTV